MSEKRRYSFSWDLIGQVDARTELGPYAGLEMYRLMQFTMRDILEQHYGTETADTLFREAGELAGRKFFDHYFSRDLEFPAFVSMLEDVFRKQRAGIVRIEEADLEKGELVLSVGEDLDCSGLPELEHEFCAYDEGLIAGILMQYTGKEVRAKEIDCWCTGDRTCRFAVTISL